MDAKFVIRHLLFLHQRYVYYSSAAGSPFCPPLQRAIPAVTRQHRAVVDIDFDNTICIDTHRCRIVSPHHESALVCYMVYYRGLWLGFVIVNIYAVVLLAEPYRAIYSRIFVVSDGGYHIDSVSNDHPCRIGGYICDREVCKGYADRLELDIIQVTPLLYFIVRINHDRYVVLFRQMIYVRKRIPDR